MTPDARSRGESRPAEPVGMTGPRRLEVALDLRVHPGEVLVATAGEWVRTLLGSCVSITLWHPARRIGAMSHYLRSTRGVTVAPDALDARYGDEALPLMVSALARHGVRATECQAKVFGGGNMFPQLAPRQAGPSIGQCNGSAARALLGAAGIPVMSECLFGDGHREIVFDIDSGDVWVRRGRPAADAGMPSHLAGAAR